MTVIELKKLPQEQKKLYTLLSLLEVTIADSEPLRDFKLVNGVPVNAQLEKCKELQKKYISLLSVVTDLKEAAADIIIKVESETQRRVLTDRYINCMKWAEILEKYNYTNYSSLFNLNQRALKSFCEVQSMNQ